MSRTPKYLTSSTQRVYSTPDQNPNTAWVYQKTHSPTSQAPESAAPNNPVAASQAAKPTNLEPQEPTLDGNGAFGVKYQEYLEQLAQGFRGLSDDLLDPSLLNGGENVNLRIPEKTAANSKSSTGRVTNAQSRKVVDIAKKYVGMNKYVYGSWDCSKFTQTVATKAGVKVPRTAATQYAYFKQKRLLTNMKNAQAGDIVFLRSSASPSGWHVGIYIGNGKMIDNAGRGKPIAVRSLAGRQVLGFGKLTSKVKLGGNYAKSVGKAATNPTGSAVRYGNTQFLVN